MANREPLWIILTDEGDCDGMEYGETAAHAVRRFYDGDPPEPVQVIEVTREIRHLWTLARRRERYAERRAAGWTRVRTSPVPPTFPKPDLGYMATMACYDIEGRCWCPKCSRFCRIEDFAGADHAAAFKVGSYVARVDYAPACWRCRGMKRAPYMDDTTDG